MVPINKSLNQQLYYMGKKMPNLRPLAFDINPFIRVVSFVSILYLAIFTSFHVNADHFTTEKYQNQNKALFEQMWDEQLEEIYLSQQKKKKRIFYTGFALWGGEKWALGDALKIGLGFENFYEDRTLFNFIFSNSENNYLPHKYPTVFDDVVSQHFTNLLTYTRDDDLIIIGLYSHGLEEKLIMRLGKEAKRAITPEEVKRFLKPLETRNVLLIISACHAGSFIPHLKSNKIAIAAAAAADKTSNGCSPLHSQTFYGENLVEVLNNSSATNGDTISNVMEKTANLIKEKEKWKPKSDPKFFVSGNFLE